MKKLAILILLVLSLTLSACGAKPIPECGTPGQPSFSQGWSGQEGDISIEYPFDVDTSMSTVNLRLIIEIRTGTVKYSALNPSGSPVWEGEVVDKGFMKEEKSFPASAGKWNIKVDATGASGGFNVCWTAAP